jgi:hypothetical protein
MTTRTESVQVLGIAPADDRRAPGDEIRPSASRIAFPPALDARFRPALAAIHDEMLARDDVVALLCFGSAPRGEAGPGSDLDLRILTNGDKRWMESRVAHGVEAQLKFGPVRSLRGMVAMQNHAIIQSFATGQLLFDKTGEATELKRFADERYRAGPRVPDQAETGVRYGLTNLIRDLEDMPEDSVAARMLAGVSVVEALKNWCKLHAMWENRKPSVMLQFLETRDPALAGRFEVFYAAPSPAGAIAVVDAVLETMGGRLYQVSLPPEPV